MDIGNIAELNTFLVLDAIRSRGQATRRELGTDLSLSAASVSRIVKRLLMAGLIAEEPGAGAVRGRTPTILRFVGPPGGVIAVDLGGTRCHGALADLAGSIVAEDFRPSGEGNAAVSALLECIAVLDARATELAMPVRAAVVGIPALIDPDTGLATAGPNVHWQGLDLLGMLRGPSPGRSKSTTTPTSARSGRRGAATGAARTRSCCSRLEPASAAPWWSTGM